MKGRWTANCRATGKDAAKRVHEALLAIPTTSSAAVAAPPKRPAAIPAHDHVVCGWTMAGSLFTLVSTTVVAMERTNVHD